MKSWASAIARACSTPGLIQALSRSAVARSGLILLAWLFVWEIGWLVEYTRHASLWYPVAGLTFAALLMMGSAAAPALAAGCLLASLSTAHHYHINLPFLDLLSAGLFFAVAHIAPYALGAFALRVSTRRGVRDITAAIVSFLVIAAGSSLLATALVLQALVMTGMMPAADLSKTWLPFWIGDLAGVLVISPVFVGLLSALLPRPLFRLSGVAGSKRSAIHPRLAAKMALTALLLSGCMLLAHWSQSPDSAFAIFFLVIPHMWIACSEAPFANVLVVALSSFLIAFWVNVLHLMDFVMVYQFAICVIGANTLFGLAVPALLSDNLHLRKMAFTDKLTQAASRERLEQLAFQAVNRCRQGNAGLSIVVFDLDYFKKINDSHGHQAGDQALQELCRVVQKRLRAVDTLGRLGGDEFVVLLPHTRLDEAIRIVERIIDELRSLKVADIGGLSASFGVAAWCPDEDYEALFRRADRALYQSKLEGRDRFSVAL
ncbi:MAG: sensor domain-containing diguanylate cyclase [Acidobacteria bacterium]|nr:sensor domain-containing diguanylate cyclase [Acidobacteriota bacterium]